MLGPRVAKLGGNDLDRPGWLEECARALKLVDPLVVVHGGGQAISALSRRLDLPVEKRDGKRVTTLEVAEVVEMVLAGPVNRGVVAALRAAGLDAVGLSGVDGGLLAARRAAGNLGHVGEITSVRAALLQSLLLAGLTPARAHRARSRRVRRAAQHQRRRRRLGSRRRVGRIRSCCSCPTSPASTCGVAQPEIAATEIEGLIAAGIATDGMAAKLRPPLPLSRAARGPCASATSSCLHPTAGTRIVAAVTQPA